MCLIIWRPKLAAPISRAILDRAAHANSDGIGLMWKDGPTLHVAKSCGKEGLGEDAILNLAEALMAKPVSLGIHFRLATHGHTDLANCHPCTVVPGLAMMHNGIIYDLPRDKERSDTRVFAEDYLRLLPRKWHHNKVVLALVADFIGKGNKLLLLDKNGKSVIVNEGAGEWNGGSWFSNTHWKPLAPTKYDKRGKVAKRGKGWCSVDADDADEPHPVTLPDATGVPKRSETQDLWIRYGGYENAISGNLYCIDCAKFSPRDEVLLWFSSNDADNGEACSVCQAPFNEAVGDDELTATVEADEADDAQMKLDFDELPRTVSTTEYMEKMYGTQAAILFSQTQPLPQAPPSRSEHFPTELWPTLMEVYEQVLVAEEMHSDVVNNPTTTGYDVQEAEALLVEAYDALREAYYEDSKRWNTRSAASAVGIQHILTVARFCAERHATTSATEEKEVVDAKS